MPERKIVSKRNAEIECIELDENFLTGNRSRLQKIKTKILRLPRINFRLGKR